MAHTVFLEEEGSSFLNFLAFLVPHGFNILNSNSLNLTSENPNLMQLHKYYWFG